MSVGVRADTADMPGYKIKQCHNCYRVIEGGRIQVCLYNVVFLKLQVSCTLFMAVLVLETIH